MIEVKNEVVLVSPGQKSFFLRGVFFNDFTNKVVSKTMKTFIKDKPKRTDTPLNILTVGTALKNAGFVPRLIDGRYEDIREKLKVYVNERTLFVGISTMTCYQIIFGLKSAQIVRKMNSKIPLVWGGMHPTVLPEETLRTSDYVDIVCKGEGEVTVVELAEALKEGRPLKDIAGIVYKDKNGGVINNRDREFIDFEKLPPLDYGLLDPSVYNLHFLSYQSSRGCPHRCKFCEVGPIHNRRYRARSIETVFKDIEAIVKKYSTRTINIIDENFFVNLNNAKKFANMVLEKGLKFKWRAWCRADYFRRADAEFWRLMKRAGLKDLEIGAESGSQKTLDNIGKDYKVDDILNAVRQLDEVGVTAKFSFMCGLPDEEKDDMEKTVRMIDYLNNDFKDNCITQLFLYMPLPMTAFYNELKRKGCVFPNRLKDWGSFLFGDKKFNRWHPWHEYAFRLALVARWVKRPPLSKIFIPLKQLDAFVSLLFLCGYISHYRWRNKFFGFPLDIYTQSGINKYIFKYLWQG